MRNICATHAFVPVYKLLAMLFHLAYKSFVFLLPIVIVIWNSLAASCLWYPYVSQKLSSIPARLCKAWLATTSFLLLAGPGGITSNNPLCTSSDASCNHSVFQKLSPRIMHMLCSTRQMLTNSDTFFKCTSIIFNNIRHLSLSNSSALSRHMRAELWTRSSSTLPESARLCSPWRGLTSRGDMGMPHCQTMRKAQVFQASQNWPIEVPSHRLASCIDPAHPMLKSQNNHLLDTIPCKMIECNHFRL